jgi:hypothetical protein
MFQAPREWCSIVAALVQEPGLRAVLRIVAGMAADPLGPPVRLTDEEALALGELANKAPPGHPGRGLADSIVTGKE